MEKKVLKFSQIRSVLAGWGECDKLTSPKKNAPAALPAHESGAGGATPSRAAVASKALAARAVKRAAAAAAAEGDEDEAPAAKKALGPRKVPRLAHAPAMAFSWDD